MIDELLRPLTVRDPAVAPLAVVASLAVELQPGLLRRLRRRLVPEASPLTEALLWSSELAGSRTASTLLLADDVQVELRRRLASDQLLLDAARAVIVEAHVGVAEILRCEEDLVYYGLVDLARLPRADLDQATLENRIRDRLEQVLGSIVADPARRQYLLAWSTRALPGLPERVQTHEAGGLLARYIAGERVGAVLAPSDRDAAIGVRWTAAGLLLSARDRAPTTLRVPPIQPLLVEITLERDGPWSEPQRVVVPAQDALTVPLEDQVTRVRLRSLRGDGLVLHRQPATATTPSRLWVLVAGAAADDIPAVERRAADTLGRAIGAHGIGLITGAFVGIDQITAEAFLSVASVGQLVSVVREGRTPSVSAGIVRLVASDLDEYWEAVVRADGVVVLSDTAGTREVARLATLAGRPVFAYPGTPAANLPGVAPIPKDVAMHAGIAAEGILRSISQRRATPSPLSRWAGPALLAAAIDCLRVNPDQAASRIDRLWDAVRNRDAPDDAILDDTIARHPAPERLLHYILLQHRLIRRATTARDARWFEPLVDAIVEETAFASEFQEARLLWQGLLALHDHLGHSPAETLRLDLELRLQAVEDRLQQFPSGETRDACARLFTDILARFADNPLRNFAGRYEHIRATEPSSDDRASALDILMLDARRTATELGVRAEHITGLYKSGRAGLRVVALACCAALPDQAPHDVILDTLAEPATRFELWTAVTAAAAVLAVEPPGTTEPIAAALLALQGPSNNPTRARRNGSTLRHASVALANYAGQIGLTDDTDLVALRLWLAAAGPRRDRGTVVVIGSSTTPDDVPFCSALGARLASHGWRLVSGRGYNVGPHVVAGYRRAEGPGFAIYSTSALDGDPPETRVFDRLEDARVQMVAAADCGIVIRGGDGTRIECELALAKPMPLLALPFTGGTAARIADTTRGHLADLGLPPPILGLLERDDRLPADEQAERTVRLLDIVLRRWSELRPPRSRRPTSTANKPRPRESLEGDLRRMPLPPRIVASRTIPRMLPEPPEELVGPLRAGQVVAVVGSGLSCAAGYPSWTGLLQGVCDEALRLCPSERPRIASAWNAIDRDSIGAAGLLLDVLGTQFPAVVISQLNRRRKLVARATAVTEAEQGGGTGPLWDQVGRDEPVEARPTLSHRHVVQMGFRVILTTNYDSLLEDAAPAGPVVYSWRDQGVPDQIARGVPLILKLHGDSVHPDDIVLTRRQYYDEFYTSKTRTAVGALLTSSRPLWIGYGHNDPDLDLLLDTARSLGVSGGFAIVAQLRPILRTRLRDAKIFPIELAHHDDVPRFLQSLARAVERPASFAARLRTPWQDARLARTRSAELGNLLYDFGVDAQPWSAVAGAEHVYLEAPAGHVALLDALLAEQNELLLQRLAAADVCECNWHTIDASPADIAAAEQRRFPPPMDERYVLFSRLLARDHAWRMLTDGCERTAEPVFFLLHGSRNQGLALFLDRVGRYLDDEDLDGVKRVHHMFEVQFAADDSRVQTVPEWEGRLRVALGFPSHKLRDSLARLLASHALMFVIRGRYSEPLGDMTGVEQTALAEFLGERLPEILASITGQPRALRVLIPVVHAAGPRGVPPSIHCGRRSMPLCVAPDRTG